VGLLYGAREIYQHDDDHQGIQDCHDDYDKAIPLGLAGKFGLDGSDPSFLLKLVRHGFFPSVTETLPYVRAGRNT
jgi:hypothetical protein